jgi:hypothetical protein
MTRLGAWRAAAIAAALLGWASAHSASAATLYREDFSSVPPATTVTLASVGWDGTEAGGGGNSTGVYDTFSYWYDNLAIAAMSSTTELIYTTEFSGSPINMATVGLAISWATRMEHQFNDDFSSGSGTGTGANLRAAIQVGGQWYASNTVFNTGNVESTTYSPPAVLPVAGATWVALGGIDGAPGVTLGSPAIPLGSITGVGVVGTFVQRQSVNIDYVDISAVPEPTSLGLFACAGLGLLLRRRRF